MAVTITLTEEQLKELYRYEQYLSGQNENGMPFEFWHVVGLMDAVVEIYETAREQVGWVPPTPEDLGIEEGPHDRDDCPCGHPLGTQGPCAGCNCADPE